MNGFLIAAAVGNGLAALLHVGCIIFGASWYRFFGAGEQMATWAEQDLSKPTFITLFITAVLSVFTLYCLSGARVIMTLPLLKVALVGMTSLFLLRGLGGFYMMTKITEQGATFWFWSSMICLALGVFHLVGTLQVWNN